MGIGTGSEQSTFIRWNGPQGEHASNRNAGGRGAVAGAQTMISRAPASRRADFEYFAVVAGLERDAKLTASGELGHKRHHRHNRLAPAIVERCFHACWRPEIDQASRGRE